MTVANQKQDIYFSDFAALEQKRAASDPAWLRSLRRAAMDRFAQLGFPTTKHEEWKYTSVAPIARTPFRASREYNGPYGVATLKDGGRAYFEDCLPLIFVDGHLLRHPLMPANSVPGGVKVGSLAAALAQGSPTLEQHLGRYASYRDNAFVALNTALMEDGGLVEIPNNVVVEKPIYLFFLSLAADEPAVSHPRNLVVVGRGSQVTIIEDYTILDHRKQVYFTNAVTEVVAGENATVEYARIEQEGEGAFHVSTLQFHQARSSVVHSTSIQFGGSLVREDVGTVLDGEGCESTLNGLYVIGGRQHVDNHTTIDHAKPHCSSRELYKGVLDGHATGVFNGKIIVRQDAQKTDSKQSNKNLLLSENSVINTKPQLEIYADDVKCTHGATIGQIDPEAVFYLRSRGIGLGEARAMLTQAFATDVISKIKFQPLRDRLASELPARLAAGLGTAAGSLDSHVSTLVEEG